MEVPDLDSVLLPEADEEMSMSALEHEYETEKIRTVGKPRKEDFANTRDSATWRRVRIQEFIPHSSVMGLPSSSISEIVEDSSPIEEMQNKMEEYSSNILPEEILMSSVLDAFISINKVISKLSPGERNDILSRSSDATSSDEMDNILKPYVKKYAAAVEDNSIFVEKIQARSRVSFNEINLPLIDKLTVGSKYNNTILHMDCRGANISLPSYSPDIDFDDTPMKEETVTITLTKSRPQLNKVAFPSIHRNHGSEMNTPTFVTEKDIKQYALDSSGISVTDKTTHVNLASVVINQEILDYMDKEDRDVNLIQKKPLFYQSFLDILESEEEIDPEKQSVICTSGFTNTLKEISSTTGLTYELVQEIAPYLKRMLAKPQSLMADTEDYYIAEDEIMSFYYVCYKWLLMLDMDWPDLNPEQRQQQLMLTLNSLPQMIEYKHTLYEVYSTRKGYHIFLVSHKMEKGSREAIEIMLQARTDPYYTILSYLRGWSVRISRKHDEPACAQLYHHVCSYGTGKALSQCMAALNVHLELSVYDC